MRCTTPCTSGSSPPPPLVDAVAATSAAGSTAAKAGSEKGRPGWLQGGAACAPVSALDVLQASRRVRANKQLRPQAQGSLCRSRRAHLKVSFQPGSTAGNDSVA